MLDKFHGLHSRLVFATRSRIRLEPEAFQAARNVAAKPITHPDLSLLESFITIRKTELIYELAVEQEISGLCDKLGGMQSRLVETVALHRFLCDLPEDAGGDAFKRQRILATIGAMIQKRLTILLLSVREDQFDQIMNMKRYWGIDYKIWEISLVGAASAAKAVLELSNAPDIDIYLATPMEDVIWGIDLYVELKDGSAGACINVKTLVGKRSRFWTEEPEPGEGNQAQENWMRLVRGTEKFNRGNGREWIPALVAIGKDSGEHLDLHHYSNLSAWVRILVSQLYDLSLSAPQRASA